MNICGVIDSYYPSLLNWLSMVLETRLCLRECLICLVETIKKLSSKNHYNILEVLLPDMEIY